MKKPQMSFTIYRDSSGSQTQFESFLFDRLDLVGSAGSINLQV
jgi:hypothetical protein